MNMRYEQIRKNLFRSEGSCWSTSRRTTCTFWPALTSASPFPLWTISRWKSDPTKHITYTIYSDVIAPLWCPNVPLYLCQTNKTHSFVPRCAFARLTNATKIKLLQRSPWTFQTRLSEIFLKSEYHSITNLSQIVILCDIFLPILDHWNVLKATVPWPTYQLWSTAGKVSTQRVIRKTRRRRSIALQLRGSMMRM